MKKIQIFWLLFLKQSCVDFIYIPKKTIKNLADFKTDLFFGIDSEDLRSSNKIDFLVDFHFGSVLVHDKALCEEQNNCRTLNYQDENKSEYQDEEYNYKKIKTYLGLQKQITTTIKQQEIHNFVNLPIRKLQQQYDKFSNVLGLSINSPIWQHWIDLYNFKDDIIHYDIILEQHKEKIIFWNIYWPLKDTWTPASKNNERYQWNMMTNMKFLTKKEKTFITSFTFDNTKDLLFELDNNSYQQLLGEFCKDIDRCTLKEHLKNDIDLLEINLLPSRYNLYPITLDDLYTIEQDQSIKFYFAKQKKSVGMPQVVLQKRFFQQYFISISNNLRNQRYYHIKINHLDTLKTKFEILYIRIVFYFFVFAFCITITYALYSKLQIKKKVLKEIGNDFYENIN